jgi:ribosomal-protein-alanine N-acetyltransferase
VADPHPAGAADARAEDARPEDARAEDAREHDTGPDDAGRDDAGRDDAGRDDTGRDDTGRDEIGRDDVGDRPDAVADAVHLVPMRRRHLRSVLRIEAQVYPRPWTLTLYMSELNLRSGRHYVVARADGAVVGYAGLLFAADEAHVTTIAVDPARHRRQIGTRLLLHQAAVARRHGSRHLTLEVRMSNVAAQGMYRRFGFQAEGVRKNYYAEVHEDAVVMWARGIDTDAYAARLDAIAADLTGPTVDEALG